MSEISCDRAVLTAPHLSQETNDKTHLYPGTAGRMSNKYVSRYVDGQWEYTHIPEIEQGK